MSARELTQEYVRELFDYDPETGVLTWKQSLNNRAPVGSYAGSIGADGYLGVGISKKRYRYHRIIWLWVHGYVPENQIDHINQDKADNRLSNLREVSQVCNMRNTGNAKNNTSGVKGVTWWKKRKKWGASLMVNGKTRHLGIYDSFDDAVCARLAGEQCLDWFGCNSNSPAFQYVQGMLKDAK